jgi:hypothetical protein
MEKSSEERITELEQHWHDVLGNIGALRDIMQKIKDRQDRILEFLRAEKGIDLSGNDLTM